MRRRKECCEKQFAFVPMIVTIQLKWYFPARWCAWVGQFKWMICRRWQRTECYPNEIPYLQFCIENRQITIVAYTLWAFFVFFSLCCSSTRCRVLSTIQSAYLTDLEKKCLFFVRSKVFKEKWADRINHCHRAEREWLINYIPHDKLETTYLPHREHSRTRHV